MYEYLDAAVVRAPAWQAERQGLPWPDLTGPDATPASWQAWLDQVWQIAEFSAAVEAASPDLARQAAQILSGRAVSERVLRRVVLSTLRYLLRATRRATPFGLLAGVAAASIGPLPTLRVGAGHLAVARVEAEWITGVIERLEADAVLRSHLTVMASDLAAGRDGHLVIERRAGGAPVQVQIRATPPVLAALEAARRPIRVADLSAALAAKFPETARSMIDALLAELVQQQFLITSLRSPMTASNQLATLLDELETLPMADETMLSALRAIRVGLQRHDLTLPLDTTHLERERVVALMRTAMPAARPAAAHRGIGRRLFDGRQATILAHLHCGQADKAAALVDHSAVIDTWEHAVQSLLRVLCLHTTAINAGHHVNTMLTAARALAEEHDWSTTVTRTRIGMLALDLAQASSEPPSGSLCAALITSASGDGYAARDVLAHRQLRLYMTTGQRRHLQDVVQGCGLGAGVVPQPLHEKFVTAVHCAETTIKSELGQQLRSPGS